MATHPLWRPYAPANADRQQYRVAHRQINPGHLREHSAEWSGAYDDLRERIERAIPNLLLAIRHVGSTAVPGLLAKPVVDIDLTVRDVENESSYAPQLEGLGFRLIFRDDMAGDPHRQFTLGTPNTNLHVWNPAAVEPQRHALFIEWLRSNEADCALYAAAKRIAGEETNIRYNDSKAAVVYDIYERAFLADAAHDHDPQPRTDV